jgi:imidazolonepropionase-like amidohydrolase
MKDKKFAPIGLLAKIVALGIAFATLGLFLPLLADQAAARIERAEPVIAIVGATLIDGNGGPVVPDAVVVVTGKRISAVGPRTSVKVPPGARIIEGKGKFVTPGFIDTNVHLSLYGAGETFVRYEQQNADLVLEAAQLSLKYGITTVRDSYGSLLPLVEVRDAINRGEKIGTRILAAGNIVGWGGPYSVTFSQTQDTNLTLFQEQINDFITQGTGQELFDMNPEELRVAINRYLDKGPDFIKYGGTAHFEYPTLIAFSPDQQKVLVEEAHKRGKVAETHATSSESLRISVLAGLDLIQHPEVLSDPYPDDLIQMIRDKKIICSILSNTITGKIWQKHLKDKEEREKKKSEAKPEQAGQAVKPQRAKTTAELRKERRDQGLGLEARRANAQKLIQSGCFITVSTDNYLGSAPEFRREPKPDHQEAGTGTLAAIEGMVELGMMPAQAIVAATKNGAVACRALDKFGTLEVGKLADLLVFEADPLADISNIRKLAIVMREGQVIDRNRLPEKPVWHGRPDGVPPHKIKN